MAQEQIPEIINLQRVKVHFHLVWKHPVPDWLTPSSGTVVRQLSWWELVLDGIKHPQARKEEKK